MTEIKKKKIKIAMVGYYNTLPFLFGLRKSESFDLVLDVPSRCMDYYSSGEADIALVPVATVLDRSDYNIVTDYCIGCVGSVRTVCLLLNGNLEGVTKIFLDQDSRTSQLLVRILCSRLWEIQPEFVECNVREIQSSDLESNEAVLMIGDKVFEKENSFENIYDLGVEWKKLTGLPFTFAVWIARPYIDKKVIVKLNQALGQGVDNLEEVLIQNKMLATKIDLREYFNEYIDFHFDVSKQEALSHYKEFYLEGAVEKPNSHLYIDK